MIRSSSSAINPEALPPPVTNTLPLAKLYLTPLTVSSFFAALYFTAARIRLAGSTRLMPASINPTALARRLDEISSSRFLIIKTVFLNKRISAKR
jgi:hypothetical protein